MLSWIWVLIVGAIIGLIAGFITSKGGSMGFIANLIAGLVGSTLGQAIFGSWGPQMAGMAIVPSILGAVILVLVVSFVLGMLRRTE
ncbi:GlsB/YeaQ/YmgE family stress response membrane protein [Lactobacillus crispatus]|uniref:GlsB/YeaQ/YmgE family stress response membrane protein n=1 Tax=Lactobacillus crispatus TaxID=47770 RepID=UPI00195E3114|nr:GlsB/YeaQ/YmgE family stress response membrane protein [Lactobacillus crispatus]MBM6873150.1 GlsB/YeaQ/YmgE family stress response membrane protein [Lactobacillus crispatus]